MKEPLVTVLMSVYNSETYLSEAVESILAQTYSHFEFLIIDDASTDRSAAIIESYQDHRICVIHNETNCGPTRSLNKGLAQALIDYAIRWVDRLQSTENGAWYTGPRVSLTQKINGAMKVITGWHAANRHTFHHAKALIDTALASTNDQEVCSHFNVMYVLYGCKQIASSYRPDEIKDFLWNRLALYKDFYHPKHGGFPFFKNQAEIFLYGKKLTQEKNEPNVHGTIMFVWGLAFIDKMLGLGLGFRVPVN